MKSKINNQKKTRRSFLKKSAYFGMASTFALNSSLNFLHAFLFISTAVIFLSFVIIFLNAKILFPILGPNSIKDLIFFFSLFN